VASAALCALAGCALPGGAGKAAATSAATRTPSAPSSFAPLAGPSEPASALPKACSQMLDTAQLQAVFGAGLPIGDNYGSYAALSSIGRTGRVACVFGVGLDSFGRQSPGAVEVSISTYTSASDAVGRAADTVQTDAQAGATTAEISVGGHPATIVVEQNAAGASSPAAPSTAATGASGPPAGSPTPGAPTGSTTAASPAANDGETELVMADGNRTFVLQIPFAKLSAQQAMTALSTLALAVYRNTLPPPGGSAGSTSSTR
jgi:hypothetical protein